MTTNARHWLGSEIMIPTRGQGALFDDVDYHEPGSELGWLPEDLFSDDETFELLTRPAASDLQTPETDQRSWGVSL